VNSVPARANSTRSWAAERASSSPKESVSTTLIGSYDLLIAGQALHRVLTLVTANVGEFSRVPDLRWENW